MNALKKTLAKYFISEDGTISVGAVGLALSTALIAAGNVVSLWPIDGADLITIGKWVAGGGAAIGIYRRVGKK